MVFSRVHGVTSIPLSIRLEFTSTFDMLDFVQLVSDHVSRDIGLDDDASTGSASPSASRSSTPSSTATSNDAGKRVFVEFDGRRADARAGADHPRPRSGRRASIPKHVADPLAPENLLKAQRPRHLPHSQLHGRSSTCSARREGGMEVRMVKRVQPAGTAGRVPATPRPDRVAHPAVSSRPPSRRSSAPAT